MRLNGGTAFEKITVNGIGVGSKTIGLPTVKSNAVSPDGMNGIIDFTEASGLFFTNRSISVVLKATNMNDDNSAASASFDEFIRKYHGKIVDLTFDDTPTYHFTGRLNITADDVRDTYRTISFIVDAEPYKHPVSGLTSVSIPISTTSNLVTGSESFVNAKNCSVVRFATGSIIGYKTDLYSTASFGFVVSGLTSNGKHSIAWKNGSGYKIELFTSASGTKINIVDNAFTATGTSVYVKVTVNAARITIFDLTIIPFPTSKVITNGDMLVNPTFSATKAMTIVIDGKPINVKSGDTWNPYFYLLPNATSTVYITAASSGSLTVKYEKAVL